MRGSLSRDVTTMGEILRDVGYATFAVGKWHLVPLDEASAAGPFDNWPLQRGFDRYYGFLDGETDQFSPSLTYDNHHILPPATPDEGYHLTDDLITKASEFIHDSISVRPDRPFFLYLALGATHAPHQAPADYLAQWRGKFDDGWDAARERIFQRQVDGGLIPPETKLAPRNPGVEEWSSLSENQRALACRLQEAFAAFLHHTDDQIGRLVADLKALGLYDNSLIVLQSDNGASQEGGPFGVLHEMKFFNGIWETPDEAVAHLEDIGGPHSHTNYPWGWAQAGNTPFRWYKQNTHEGGVHVPLIVKTPAALQVPAGGVRDQFAYVTDIAATVCDLAGVTVPDTYRGISQLPLAGHSLVPTFAHPTHPSVHPTQYFEMVGHRAIIHDGWKAVTRHVATRPYDEDVWELYHYDSDRSETDDLAESEPDKLAELVALWWDHTTRHQILPLDDRMAELLAVRFSDHGPHRPDRIYRYYPPVSPLPAQAGAAIGGRSFDLVAEITRRGSGVIFSSGTENSGLSFFVLDDQLIFDYNYFQDHQIVRSAGLSLADGDQLALRFRRGDIGAQVSLFHNEREVASGEIPHILRVISSVGHRVATDTAGPVSELYTGPFPFSGEIRAVTISLISPSRQVERDLSDSQLRAEMGRQ
jgi:arylsulfatase